MQIASNTTKHDPTAAWPTFLGQMRCASRTQDKVKNSRTVLDSPGQFEAMPQALPSPKVRLSMLCHSPFQKRSPSLVSVLAPMFTWDPNGAITDLMKSRNIHSITKIRNSMPKIRIRVTYSLHLLHHEIKT